MRVKWYRAPELLGIYPGVDYERTRWRMNSTKFFQCSGALQEFNDSSPGERRAVMIGEMEIKESSPSTGAIFLDPNRNSPRAQEFAEGLGARIVGQERAVRQMSNLYQIYLAGMNSLNRPIGTMLFLGPTGSGKTRVVEAAAEVLFGDANAM